MLKNEIQYFFAALSFYTRIPCTCDNVFKKSLKYFPLIGGIIGGIGVVTLLIFNSILPLSVSIVLSMAATIYASGALHEDGFTDTCDAFGGGWRKEQIFSIMKDSRIGAYGTVGIIVLLSLKGITLYEIGLYSLPILLVTYFNAHIVSRFMTILLIQNHDYVQKIENSKSKEIVALSLGELLYSSLFMLLAASLFNSILLYAYLIAYLAQVYLGYYFQKRIGGYTGDCLGATQQITEVIFYLGVLALCKFI